MNDFSAEDEAIIAELARLLEAARDKPEESPEMKALDALCGLVMERTQRGLAS